MSDTKNPGKSVCLFCGKPSSKTRTLIQASSGNCICSECVQHCNEILKQKACGFGFYTDAIILHLMKEGK